jgi:putative Holliday junction resolvase
VIASPLPALVRTESNADADRVLEVAAEQGVRLMLVGIPFTLSGQRGSQARAVDEFRRLLAKKSALPVATYDERLSTVEAARALRSAGVKPSRDRARLDSASAAVVLQSYLDAAQARRTRRE